jgi:hypothetical protein
MANSIAGTYKEVILLQVSRYLIVPSFTFVQYICKIVPVMVKTPTYAYPGATICINIILCAFYHYGHHMHAVFLKPNKNPKKPLSTR